MYKDRGCMASEFKSLNFGAGVLAVHGLGLRNLCLPSLAN